MSACTTHVFSFFVSPFAPTSYCRCPWWLYSTCGIIHRQKKTGSIIFVFHFYCVPRKSTAFPNFPNRFRNFCNTDNVQSCVGIMLGLPVFPTLPTFPTSSLLKRLHIAATQSSVTDIYASRSRIPQYSKHHSHNA